MSTELKTPRRILSLDTFRGFGIFYVVVLHALVMRVFEQERSHIQELWDRTPLFLVILFFPWIMIMIWGALFTFISGISVSYSLSHQALSDITNLKPKFNGVIVRSILILLVQYLFLFLFSNQISGNTEVATHSFITGSIETGNWFALPDMYHFVVAPTLEAIVFGNLLITLVYSILWRKGKFSYKKAFHWVLGIGITIFVIAAIAYQIIGDQQVYIDQLGTDGNYLGQMIMTRLFVGRYSFFPTVAYSMFGAVLGLMIADGKSYKKIASFGFSFAFIFLGIFLISILGGFDYVEDLAGEHQPWNIYCFNLGGQMLVYTILLKMDYTSPERTKGHAKRSQMLRRYGKMTLTLYFFEGIFSISLYRLFYWLNGGPFYTQLWLAATFIASVFLFWYFVLKLWEKRKFAFSIEDIIRRVEHAILTPPKRKARLRKLNTEVSQVKN